MSSVALADRLADPSRGEAVVIAERLGDLPMLRTRFDMRKRDLEGELSQSDISVQRKLAIDSRDRLARKIDAVAPDIAVRAQQLTGLPEAGYEAGRAEAITRAQDLAEDARYAERNAFAAREQAGRDLKSAEDAVTSARRPVHIEPERTPTDRLAAALCEAEATAGAKAAGQDALEAQRDRDQAHDESQTAGELERTLAGLGSQVRIALRMTREDAEPVAEPFSGDAASARTEGERVAHALTSAQDADAIADRAWRSRIETLRATLSADEYHELSAGDRLHRRLLTATPDALARDVADLVMDVRTTIGVLRADLDKLAEDIKLAVTALAREVRSALSQLRGAERDSHMPPSLRGWGGEPFLTIRFESPPAGEIEPRLTTFVHEILRASQRPKGTALLRAALARAVAGGFAVKVLKPNDGFALIRIPITELASVTVSGGQRSTVATALLLMLSERRRKTRSAGRPASVGSLFLDNPFGTANAGFLIDVQQTVARAANIQLIYSTGIADFTALRRFPNPIALSNDAARRTMRKYVRTNPDLQRLLEPSDGGPGGRVTASSVVVAALRADGDGRTA
jgi:hypothetical protein